MTDQTAMTTTEQAAAPKQRKKLRKPKDFTDTQWGQMCGDVLILLKNLKKQATAHGYYSDPTQRESWKKFQEAVPVAVPDLVHESGVLMNIQLMVPITDELRKEWLMENNEGFVDYNKFSAWYKKNVGRSNGKWEWFVKKYGVRVANMPDRYSISVSSVTTYGPWPKGSTVVRDGEAYLASLAEVDPERATQLTRVATDQEAF